MYTSVVLLALSGFAPAANLEEPSWLTDYGFARKLGRKEERPLAVLVGTGKAGWDQLSRDGQLGKEARRLLASKYVCVYLDKAQPAAKELASAFEIRQGTGLVISDRTGKLQAFRHDGDLANEALVRYLSRYAEPERTVQTTETVAETRTSYYAPVRSSAGQYAPSSTYYPTSFGGGGGRSC